MQMIPLGGKRIIHPVRARKYWGGRGGGKREMKRGGAFNIQYKELACIQILA